MTHTAAPALTLAAITDALNASLPLASSHFYVENIGGGVYAVLDYSGLTVTINGGQRSVDVADEGPADVLICRDGAGVAARTATTPDEVAALLATAL